MELIKTKFEDIRFVLFKRKKVKSYRADNYLAKDLSFWQELEVHCVSECCGINAFDFSKEWIRKTIVFYNRVSIIKNLNELIDELESTELRYTISEIFNDYKDTKVFVEIIKGILRNI